MSTGSTSTKLAQAEHGWIFSWEFWSCLGRGIIRNANGEWVGGYASAIGITTSIAVELWALWNGLNMCIELNLPAVIIELDAKLVVDLLKKAGGSLNGNDVIVANCKDKTEENT